MSQMYAHTPLYIWRGWVSFRQSRNLMSLFVTFRFLFCMSRLFALFENQDLSLFLVFKKTSIVCREGTLRICLRQPIKSILSIQMRYLWYSFQYILSFAMVLLFVNQVGFKWNSIQRMKFTELTQPSNLFCQRFREFSKWHRIQYF